MSRTSRKRGGLRVTISLHLTTEQMGLYLLREVERMTPAEKLKVRRILSKAFNSCRLGEGGKWVN